MELDLPSTGNSPLPREPLPQCGNARLDPGEECDDGLQCASGEDCTADRFRCLGVSTAGCQPRSGDGCSAVCTLEPLSVSFSGLGPDGGAAAATPGGEAAAAVGRADASVITERGAASDMEVPSQHRPDAGEASQGSPDEEPRPCDRVYSTPEALVGLQATGSLWAPALSEDGQTLYYSQSDGNGVEAIFVASRVEGVLFNAGQRLEVVSFGEGAGSPMLADQQRRLFFFSERSGGGAGRDLWETARPNRNAEFEFPTPVYELNSNGLEHLPWLSEDALRVLFVSTRAGGLGQSDLWMAHRDSVFEPFEDIELLQGVNSNSDEGRAALSGDGLHLYFTSDRPGGAGSQDLWFAQRVRERDDFSSPVNLDALNGTSRELDPFLTRNGHELLFASDRGGGMQLYRSLLSCRNEP